MENDRLVVFALGHIMHKVESLFNVGDIKQLLNK